MFHCTALKREANLEVDIENVCICWHQGSAAIFGLLIADTEPLKLSILHIGHIVSVFGTTVGQRQPSVAPTRRSHDAKPKVLPST